ncbi:hypothetical protein REPUB_Repub20aG0114900 [Reevesia pubescens]
MLLKDSSDKLLAVKLLLPSVCWSSTAKTAPFVCTLRDCRLPSFPDDISWLQRGSHMGNDIDNHRLLLEKCLIEYLTQSSKMMGIPLATKETSCHDVTRQSGDSLKLQLEGDISPYCLSHPSLDKIIEVGCRPLKSQRIGLDPEPSQVETAIHIEVEEAATTSICTKDKEDSSQRHELAMADDVTCTTNKSNSSYGKMVAAGIETDRLSQLLEKCNIVQNSIDEKLSIYF